MAEIRSKTRAKYHSCLHYIKYIKAKYVQIKWLYRHYIKMLKNLGMNLLNINPQRLKFQTVLIMQLIKQRYVISLLRK